MWIAVVAGVTLGAARPAAAYDHKFTHRWLTRMAVEYLVAAYPGQYDELLAYVDRAAAGAEHEDDLFLDGDDDPSTLRVMRHFYRPPDETGLTMNGQRFPSSLQWATGGREDNAWDWDDGIAAFAAGDRDEGYFVLGHMAHLVQDLTVPAHTHLDIHGPPFGDDYENYCSSQMIDEWRSRLPLPPKGAPIPEFSTPAQAWQATAQASYWRSLYPGVLGGERDASGVVTDMFPGLRWSWVSDTWVISDPPVGDLGEDFFEDEPGYYYFKNAEYPAAVDRARFDPQRPRAVEMATNASGASMTALMARDLIPIAVLHSAGIMKLYLDEAYAVAPVGDAATEPRKVDPPAGDAGGCRVAGRRGGLGDLWIALCAMGLTLTIRRTR